MYQLRSNCILPGDHKPPPTAIPLSLRSSGMSPAQENLISPYPTGRSRRFSKERDVPASLQLHTAGRPQGPPYCQLANCQLPGGHKPPLLPTCILHTAIPLSLRSSGTPYGRLPTANLHTADCQAATSPPTANLHTAYCRLPSGHKPPYCQLAYCILPTAKRPQAPLLPTCILHTADCRAATSHPYCQLAYCILPSRSRCARPGRPTGDCLLPTCILHTAIPLSLRSSGTPYGRLPTANLHTAYCRLPGGHKPPLLPTCILHTADCRAAKSPPLLPTCILHTAIPLSLRSSGTPYGRLPTANLHTANCQAATSHPYCQLAYCILPSRSRCARPGRPTGDCLLPTCILPTARRPQATPTANLHTAYCILHTAYCILHTAYCILPPT
jgi:hypothetical protein